MSNANKEPASSQVQRPARLPARLSLTWLLPLAAIVFAGWVLWDSYTDRGPLVEITFDKAGGVTAGETRVRRNDVDVGKVESVRLADDLNSVVVSVRMNPQVAPYLDQDTVFGVREDLVMKYEEHSPETFPDGYALSGSVTQPYLVANFDLRLVPES